MPPAKGGLFVAPTHILEPEVPLEKISWLTWKPPGPIGNKNDAEFVGWMQNDAILMEI